MAQKTVQGEYYFSRQEMASGFNFTPDGKFQFFYSYGALDRNATGTFSVEDNILKLKSDKVAGHDFTVTKQSKQGNGYTLIFEHPNSFMLENILCIFFDSGKQQVEYTDNQGEIHVNLNHCDSIYIQHNLYPDIVTRLLDSLNTNNTFTLSINPSLEQVSFKRIEFKIADAKTITCQPNYFMNLPDIKFTKE